MQEKRERQSYSIIWLPEKKAGVAVCPLYNYRFSRDYIRVFANLSRFFFTKTWNDTFHPRYCSCIG